MPSPEARPHLVIIVGPTAVGKTEISIRLAERLNGEIVSADSRLFYCGMDIGTAKPSPAERARVPHHLINIANPDETLSLAIFQRAAAEAISGIHQRGRLPFLVGGTGQYIRAVTQGWAPPPQAAHLEMRALLEKLAVIRGYIWLHEALTVLDPDAAQRIDPRNVRRTVRALEVIFSTGRRFSEQRRHGGSPYRVLTIGLARPRSELYARIDARIEAMFAQGLSAEVGALLQQGYNPNLPTLSAIGYRECILLLNGEITHEEAVLRMKRATRQFVRRQANWFKPDDPAIHWFTIGEDINAEIERLIRREFPDSISR